MLGLEKMELRGLFEQFMPRRLFNFALGIIFTRKVIASPFSCLVTL